MTRVAIYGGAFDPPHLAHVFTITWLLQRLDLDEIWLLPAAEHVFAKAMTPFERRVEMLEQVVAALGSPRVRVQRIEAEVDSGGRTFETLSALQARHPDHRFRLVMGADNLTASDRWYRFDELVARWPVLALGRPGHEAALRRFSREPWCEAGPTLPGVSSTRLRAALRGGGDPEALAWLPDACRTLAEETYRAPVTEALTRVWIFGAGRLGRTLAAALRGGGIEIAGLWNRGPRAEATAVGALPADLRADAWILAVSDPAITALAARLAAHAHAPPVALHCAGRLDAAALAPLAARGIATGSLHPLQSLGDDPGALRGAWCALEGAPAAQAIAEQLTRAFGGLPVRIPHGGKPAYHAAAVLSANLATPLTAAGVALLVGLGLPADTARAMLNPLLRGTAQRLAALPPAEALTGPFARGDTDAVAAHIQALRTHAPAWLDSYRALARATADWLDWSAEARAALERALQ